MDKTEGIPPIGELLVQWQLVSENDRDAALADAKKHSLPVGLALRMHDAVDLELLHNAVTAQALMRDSLILPQQAQAAMAVVIRKRIQVGLALDLLGIEVGQKKRCRLGELLQESDIIPREELKSRLNCAKSTGLPLGRVVSNLSDVPQDVIDLALRLQSQVRRGVMTREQAIEQIYAARRYNAVVSNVSHSLMEKRTQLGQLLSLAGLISEKDVEYALIMSSAEGKALGEALTSLNLIKPYEVHAALEVQHMIRTSKISFNQGLSELKRLLNGEFDQNERTGTLKSIGDKSKNSISFSSFLKLTNIVGSKKNTEMKKDFAKHNEARELHLEAAWQELRSAPTRQMSPSEGIHIDIKNMLQSAGFMSEKQMSAVQRAALAYQFFRDEKFTMEQALIQFHRLQDDTDNKTNWGTIPPVPTV